MAAHIRKRNDRGGAYYLCDGRIQFSLKTTVKRFAEAELENYLRKKHHLGPKITVGEYYEKWIKTKSASMARRSLVRSYQQHFTKYILPETSRMAISSISVSVLANLRDRLLNAPLSPKTARNILDGSFRALWRDAMAEEIVAVNPFVAIRWPAIKHSPPDPFSADEKAAILAYVREHHAFYYPWVYTMFETGMRPSEAIALRICDVDFGRDTFSISKSRNLGADHETKTTASRRTIQVSPDVLQMVDAIRRNFEKPDDPVFYNKWSGGFLDANQWARVYWKKICEGAGVQHRKFYSTRHTFITLMIEADENPKAVADYCGTSLAMIQLNYCGRLALSHHANLGRGVRNVARNMVDPTGIEPASELIETIKIAVNSTSFRR